jgi:hypothetical protein
MDELNKKAKNDIDRILAEVDAAKPAQEQTHDAAAPTEPAELAPKRVIDIHVYELAEGEETPRNEEEQQETSVPIPAEPPHRSRRRALFLLIGGLCILLIAVIVALLLYPLFVAEATITIIPASKQVSTTNTVIVVTGQPTGAQQVPGSMLAPVSMSQVKTVTTTGRGHQDAQPGHGLVTFYNSATSAQTITAGTLLTGSDGVQIVTDQDAIIPAVNYSTSTLGHVTVAAHTTMTGPGGNIRAGDIYGPCCRLNVSAVNGPFTGGQEARDFQTVTQQDIDGAVSNLKTSLHQSVQAALKTQVPADQTLITPVPCQQSVTPDHRVGEEATRVHVVFDETCAGATYNAQSLQHLVLQQLTQEASQQLGKGYVQSGTVQSSILQAMPEAHGAIRLLVRSTVSYAYQFTEAQQQNMKAAIAGKSKAQATSILLQLSGVQSVSLSLSAGEQLPTDPNHIHLVFLVTS